MDGASHEPARGSGGGVWQLICADGRRSVEYCGGSHARFRDSEE